MLGPGRSVRASEVKGPASLLPRRARGASAQTPSRAVTRPPGHGSRSPRTSPTSPLRARLQVTDRTATGPAQAAPGEKEPAKRPSLAYSQSTRPRSRVLRADVRPRPREGAAGDHPAAPSAERGRKCGLRGRAERRKAEPVALANRVRRSPRAGRKRRGLVPDAAAAAAICHRNLGPGPGPAAPSPRPRLRPPSLLCSRLLLPHMDLVGVSSPEPGPAAAWGPNKVRRSGPPPLPRSPGPVLGSPERVRATRWAGRGRARLPDSGFLRGAGRCGRGPPGA